MVLHAPEPAHARIIGSPAQVPRLATQVPPSVGAPPVQPTVTVLPGVHEKVPPERQRQSAPRPSPLPEGHAPVMSVVPASTGGVVHVRDHSLAQAPGVVGPDAVPP